MSVENSQDRNWRRLKEQYLKQIEEMLVESDQQNVDSIVNDVRSHLDRRFAELGPQQQTQENFQNIIAAMGPPSDYAELLGEKPPIPPAEMGIWRRFFVNAALSIVIIATIVLFAQIMSRFLPYEKVFSTQPFQQGSFTVDTYMTPLGRYFDNTKYPFIDDPSVIGKWVSVDLVKDPQEFTPGQKRWRWDLWFKGITFFKDGTTNWAWNWTNGLLLHTGNDHTASHYIIKTIDDEQYMFFEWKSGDYIILHRKPIYYVLKKETGAAAADNYVQKAEQIVRLMSQKQFDTVVDSFDATMKAALPSSKLTEVWAQLEQAGGEFKDIDGPARTEQQGSMMVIFVPGKWERNELDFKIVFNSDSKVSGLWMVAPGPRSK
jgi:bla regulator protein BlaR1